MSKIAYIAKKFNTSSYEIIDQANRIIEEYEAEGFQLTLRQLYYQFVSRDLLKNQQREYKRLGSIISDVRLAGLIDWHDPSGIDMTRDIRERQNLFETFGLEVNRIALNMDQINKYNPPPNPAKLTDTRCHTYIAQFGYESWELDALEPRVLHNLIKKTVLSYRDGNLFDETIKQEREYLETLSRIERNWQYL